MSAYARVSLLHSQQQQQLSQSQPLLSQQHYESQDDDFEGSETQDLPPHFHRQQQPRHGTSVQRTAAAHSTFLKSKNIHRSSSSRDRIHNDLPSSNNSSNGSNCGKRRPWMNACMDATNSRGNVRGNMNTSRAPSSTGNNENHMNKSTAAGFGLYTQPTTNSLSRTQARNHSEAVKLPLPRPFSFSLSQRPSSRGGGGRPSRSMMNTSAIDFEELDQLERRLLEKVNLEQTNLVVDKVIIIRHFNLYM